MRTAGTDMLDYLLVAAMVALLALVARLPPDTSLVDIKQSGILRVCVPVSYPPLVTSDPSAPGIDIEVLGIIAEELDVRLVLNRITAMGRDFNPRNWRVTRAQCHVLAGGVVASPSTRTFLETTDAHLSTGWVVLSKSTLDTLENTTIGFYSGTSGLDRIALGRYLRQQGARPVTVSTDSELVAGIVNGEFDAGVTEALRARQLAWDYGWRAQWLPEVLGRYPIALGLWKGDLTLKRALQRVLSSLEGNGRLADIVSTYELAPIEPE